MLCEAFSVNLIGECEGQDVCAMRLGNAVCTLVPVCLRSCVGLCEVGGAHASLMKSKNDKLHPSAKSWRLQHQFTMTD